MRLAGVIGWPVGHSLSPALHGHWLKRYGVDGAYLPLAVAPDRLETALAGLQALGFAGCNVTVPHKEAALPLMARLTPIARKMGAVNTIVIGEDGALEGDNTDGVGFLANLSAGAPPGWRVTDGPACVIGAGGAARAVVAALAEAGAPGIRVINRTLSRAEALTTALGGRAFAWEEAGAAMADAALLVNASSLGMTGQPALTLTLDSLPETAIVTDLVYRPLETALLRAARARGNPVVDGLGMLLHQAVPGFAAWFGVDPVVDDTLRAAVLARIGE